MLPFTSMTEWLNPPLRTCHICNIGRENPVERPRKRLSRLQGASGWIRFDSRNAGASAVLVGLAATQGWGERGPSATLAGNWDRLRRRSTEPEHVGDPGAKQERTCPWNKALEVRI